MPSKGQSTYEGVLLDSTSSTLKTFKGTSIVGTTPLVVGTRQICSPTNLTDSSSSTSTSVSNGLQVALEGVVNGAGVIAIGAVFILLGILIFNGCMRYCGGCVVWFVVASILVCLSVSGVFFLTMADSTKVADEKSGYQAGAAVCFILAVVWAVIICISRKCNQNSHLDHGRDDTCRNGVEDDVSLTCVQDIPGGYLGCILDRCICKPG